MRQLEADVASLVDWRLRLIRAGGVENRRLTRGQGAYIFLAQAIGNRGEA